MLVEWFSCWGVGGFACVSASGDDVQGEVLWNWQLTVEGRGKIIRE